MVENDYVAIETHDVTGGGGGGKTIDREKDGSWEVPAPSNYQELLQWKCGYRPQRESGDLSGGWGVD